LLRLPNVHWLGQRDYDELPSLAKAFDVAVVPFRIYELTKAARPLKIREYLAAGLPVVSTIAPEFSMREVVSYADGYRSFVDLIEYEIRHNQRDKIIQRQNAVRHDTWDKRAEYVFRILQSSLKTH